MTAICACGYLHAKHLRPTHLCPVDEPKAAVHGLTVQEYEDLQVWIRHGRIGRGRTYQQEVERAKQIDAARRS